MAEKLKARKLDGTPATPEELEMLSKPPIFEIEVDATPEEMEAFNKGNTSSIHLKRVRDKMTGKMSSLYKLENAFMNQQKAKNNTRQTLLYYEKVFKNLYRFVAYLCAEDKEYSEVFNFEVEDESEYGKILPIAVLEHDDFEMLYREYILDYRDCNEQTLNNIFRGWRAIAYFAMEKGWIEKRTIHIKEVEPSIKNVYTEEEIAKLTKKPDFENFIEYRNWTIIKYLLATGNRISSVVALKIEDLDFDEGSISVNVQKNRHPIRIAMVESLKPILIDYINHYRCDREGYPLLSAPLFPNIYGEETTGNQLTKSLAEYNKSRGVEKTSTHLWRHTFAKRWITSGGDILSLQKMLGHRSLKMVQRYSNLYSTDLKPIAEKHVALNVVKSKNNRQKLVYRK